MDNYFPRVIAAAKEFNIGTYTLIDFLISKGFNEDLKATSKLTKEMYVSLIEEFKGDKKQTAEIKSGRTSNFENLDAYHNPQNLSSIDITANNPKVFISYSWDNHQHTKWVLKLANNLCKNGIVVLLDQYDLRTGENLSHFMEDAIRRSEKVLIIMTENYALKADKRQGGVGYEYSIITADFVKDQNFNKKYIPILRGKNIQLSIPSFLQSFVYLDMSNEHDYANSFGHLVRDIFEAHEIYRPAIGPIPEFVLKHNK